jgi:glutaredoxin
MPDLEDDDYYPDEEEGEVCPDCGATQDELHEADCEYAEDDFED